MLRVSLSVIHCAPCGIITSYSMFVATSMSSDVASWLMIYSSVASVSNLSCMSCEMGRTNFVPFAMCIVTLLERASPTVWPSTVMSKVLSSVVPEVGVACTHSSAVSISQSYSAVKK